jgi:GT2 family glycosyltransferase
MAQINNMTDIKIFAIVVTYNGSQWISKCINSLLLSNIKLEIIVIDNGSGDNTLDFILSCPQVKLFKSEINLGFGKANNIGIRHALQNDADYIFLLNQDAWVEESTVKNLLDSHIKNPEFGILSPVHHSWDGDKLDWYFLEMISSEKCPGFINDLYFSKQKVLYDCNFIHAACWLISRKCVSDVGLFDPIFPHYGEDNNYFQRAVGKGFRGGICTLAKVFHYGTNKDSKHSKTNNYLRTIQNVVNLTNPNIALLGNLVLLFKNMFYSFFDLIFSRQLNEFFNNWKVFIKTIAFLPKIIKSRKMYKVSTPFL